MFSFRVLLNVKVMQEFKLVFHRGLFFIVLSRFLVLNSFKRDGVLARELAKQIRVSFIPGTHGRMILMFVSLTLESCIKHKN